MKNEIECGWNAASSLIIPDVIYIVALALATVLYLWMLLWLFDMYSEFYDLLAAIYNMWTYEEFTLRSNSPRRM